MSTKQKMQSVFEHELDKQFPDSRPHKIIILENNRNNIISIIKDIDSEFDKLRTKVIGLRNRVMK